MTEKKKHTCYCTMNPKERAKFRKNERRRKIAAKRELKKIREAILLTKRQLMLAEFKNSHPWLFADPKGLQPRPLPNKEALLGPICRGKK